MTANLWAELGLLVGTLGGSWWLVRRVDRDAPRRGWRERMAEKQRLRAWRRLHPGTKGWRVYWWIGSGD
jgi:hypothetical protein